MTFSRIVSPSKRQLDAVGGVAVVSGRRAVRRLSERDRQVERQFGAGLEARQRLFAPGCVKHAVHGRGGDVELLEQRAQGLAAFDAAPAASCRRSAPRRRAIGSGGSGSAIDRRDADGSARHAGGLKPGTIAATSMPSVANRLACAHCRRDQRPLKPSERWRASTGRCRAASRNAFSRSRRSRLDCVDWTGSRIHFETAFEILVNPCSDVGSLCDGRVTGVP